MPEKLGGTRNWDYRFCWLRDAYFVIHALNRLGATGTMESYLSYLTNLVAGAGPEGSLQPVYGIGLESALLERQEKALPGYRGMGPVRVGNQAHEHIQNDVYGSAVLAATQAFFDARLLHPASDQLYALLEVVGERAIRVWNRPVDASVIASLMAAATAGSDASPRLVQPCSCSGKVFCFEPAGSSLMTEPSGP